jgi:hypothetical protein
MMYNSVQYTLATRLNQRIKEVLLYGVLPGAEFRMPLYTHKPGVVRQFHRLNAAIVRMRGHAQPRAQAINCLVVPRDRCTTPRAKNPRQMRARLKRHSMSHPAIRLGTVGNRAAGQIGQVCVQGAAQRNIEHLRAAADRQRRHLLRKRQMHQRYLGVIAYAINTIDRGVAFLTVERRVHIAASRQDQPVATGQQFRWIPLPNGQNQG